ncbi:hypothetical protein NBRC10513v2_007452 [Rhodotorula toruloides]|uniref:Zn(2)-C6 fungal-type domain-containing protein n=2 Tax=Rhodotorula toruloides TaxID=5286 RepID=A0A2S9ZXU0_RHOTO|nr:hypothetical protein AAT19DRAFT_11329 [Rhodotorula toruloides]
MSAAPVASTSSVADPSESSTSKPALGKRKRLPACDCCKMRRLKCEPVPPPGSCPRCKATGVVCTTTPTVRKKAVGRTGKRIEEAKATFGTADPDAPDFMGASNTPWLPLPQSGSLATSVQPPTFSNESTENQLSKQEISSALISHLLELYQALPQSWLPIGVRGKVFSQFEAAGRQLDALSPDTEVLARVTIALTSRLSSHPALFGPGSPVPPYETLTSSYLESHPDLRQYGKRRQAVCEQLRREAVELAWRRGTLAVTSEENMASCYLLELLEGRNDPVAGKPYGSAFVSHLQTILNGQDAPGATMKIVNMSLAWSALIMREALQAANAGRTSHFTATDDLILCGEVPRSIGETLLESVEDVDVRDSVRLFFAPMRPYTYHCARLARECGEKITGTAARRQPFSEQYLAKYLTQLDHLLHLFALLESRIAFVLSPAATSAHSLPAPFETERQFIMRACLHTLGLAWSSLSLPVHLELNRRIAELRDPPPDHQSASHLQPSRKRTLERLELLRKQVEQVTLKAARMVAQCVHEAPSLAFLVQLSGENLDKWVKVLVDAKTVEDGGAGITKEERERDLRWILQSLKTMGWSWTDLEGLTSMIEEALGGAALEDAPKQEADPASPQLLPEATMPDFPNGMLATAPSAANAFDFASHAQAQASTSAAQPPTPPQPTFASTSNAPAAPLPDLSTLESLFGSAPAPADPPPGLPDLSTLISLYSSGALNPILTTLSGTMDVNTLASQYFAGTLNVNALLGTLGGGMGGMGEAAGASPAPSGAGAGDGSMAEFDLAAFLAEPAFGMPSPGGFGGGGAGGSGGAGDTSG